MSIASPNEDTTRNLDFTTLVRDADPLLALAPMQDVTDLPFWRLLTQYSRADLYFTEYFRVHGTSRLEKHILCSITENPTGRLVVAQLIGNDATDLVRAAKELQHYPVAAVDLNLGCPAPVVYRKCAGGGLLRDLPRVDRLLGALRDAISIKFTVKTRIGFDHADSFDDLLKIFARHSLDLVTVHGRTVTEMYGPRVHYDLIARAVQALPCPVLANGDVHSADKAQEVLRLTGAHGLMIGRGAIRNPWLFDHIRASRSGTTPLRQSGRELLRYVHALYEATSPPEVIERLQVQKMKKYLNYLGVGVDREGRFLHEMRRAETRHELFAICDRFMNHEEAMHQAPSPTSGNSPDMLAA